MNAAETRLRQEIARLNQTIDSPAGRYTAADDAKRRLPGLSHALIVLDDLKVDDASGEPAGSRMTQEIESLQDTLSKVVTQRDQAEKELETLRAAYEARTRERNGSDTRAQAAEEEVERLKDGIRRMLKFEETAERPGTLASVVEGIDVRTPVSHFSDRSDSTESDNRCRAFSKNFGQRCWHVDKHEGWHQHKTSSETGVYSFGPYTPRGAHK